MRRLDLGLRLGRGRSRLRRRQRFRHLQVRGVIVGVGEGDCVLARVGQHVELLRVAAADAAGVGAHGAEAQLHPLENPRVGAVHSLVALVEGCLVEMEGVGVLHGEFARPHHAETRPDLVPELRLDLVEIDRQLPVALDFPAREVSDHFLVSRAVAEGPLVAVTQAQQFRPELVPAAGFLPQLCGLNRGHEQFDGTGAVHLLAHDGLDFAQCTQADRQPGVHAGGEAADQPCAQHELVADDLRIGGDVAQGVDGVGGESHRRAEPLKNRPRMLTEGRSRAAAGTPRVTTARCAPRRRYLSCGSTRPGAP